MKEYTVRVPDQLAELLDDQVLEVHERWQAFSYDQVVNSMPEPVTTEYGRVVILDPAGDRDEGRTVWLGLPHQQAWKPSMAIRAGFMQQAVTPNSRVIVLPNNSAGYESYYQFDKNEMQAAHAGNLVPFYAKQARLLDSLGVQGEVYLTGYSLGALTAAGLALIGSDRWQARVVNADEASNLIRTPRELRQDFMKSGGWGDQRQAIEDAAIPALSEALNRRRLAADYLRFGMSTKIPENAAMGDGMAWQPFNDLIDGVVNLRADAVVKVGRVSGSHITHAGAFNETARSLPSASFVEYSGEGTHMHTTGDNVVAHALMFKQAVVMAQ